MISIEDIIDSWNSVVGLTIESIREVEINCDEVITLTIIKFTNNKYIIQHDQSYWTTFSGLIHKHNFEHYKKYLQ